ncbi:MAG: mechanosensitive ion channel [Alphaproteobacteria bacterium]|nr:mechanosensitive ion channel [Alphaproteobacteria bacterium]
MPFSQITDFPTGSTAQVAASTIMERAEGAMVAIAAWAGPRVAGVLAWISENGMAQAIALAAAVGIFIILRLARATFCRLLRSSKAPPMAARNVASRLVGGTSSLLLFLAAARIVGPFTPGVPDAASALLTQALRVVLIVQVAIWLRELVRAFTAGFTSRSDVTGATATAVSLITTVTGVVIWAIAAIMVLNNFGIDVAPLVAGLGVGGLAIGLAAQSVFRDLFSSLAIVFDKPFVRGDTISFNDGAIFGIVENIGVKTTRLRALTGEQVIVGNSMILDKEIRNFQRLNARRSTHHLAVVYQTPYATLAALPEWMKNAVDAVDGARFDRCHLKSYGDSGIVFELVFWSGTSDYLRHMDIQQAVLLNVHRAFEEGGVVFAYPTRTIHMAKGA